MFDCIPPCKAAQGKGLGTSPSVMQAQSCWTSHPSFPPHPECGDRSHATQRARTTRAGCTAADIHGPFQASPGTNTPIVCHPYKEYDSGGCSLHSQNSCRMCTGDHLPCSWTDCVCIPQRQQHAVSDRALGFLRGQHKCTAAVMVQEMVHRLPPLLQRLCLVTPAHAALASGRSTRSYRLRRPDAGHHPR
jgi:hypothetical protein